jgi:inner membrane protein
LDNLTHSLFALTLARTPLGRAGRGTTTALVLASNAPDIDFVATAGGTVKYLQWHRGITHGPIGVIGLGVIVAGMVWYGRGILDRRAAQTDKTPPGKTAPAIADASFGMLVAVSIIGAILHVGMDLPTSYGTRLLSPFTWTWFGADWMPIVDIYLLIALVAGLIFGQRSMEARRRNATIVLAFMAANYGARAAAHHRALELVPRVFGPTLPQPCDPREATLWPIDAWPRTAEPSSPPEGRRCLVDVAAMPSFTSPFRWRIIVGMWNAYEVRDVDLLDARFRGPEGDSSAPWRLTTRYPNIWTPAVHAAARSHLGQAFLGFSRMPSARWNIDRAGITTVRFTDMRFAAGPATADQPVSRGSFFTASIKVAPDGRILDESLGR